MWKCNFKVTDRMKYKNKVIDQQEMIYNDP